MMQNLNKLEERHLILKCIYANSYTIKRITFYVPTDESAYGPIYRSGISGNDVFKFRY